MLDQQISSNGIRARLFSGLPVSERTLELAGISTAVVEGGEGPPVVLLHGPAGNAAHWMRVMPLLVQTHRVIAPDLPAHGASQAFDGALDLARVLNWLGELIQRTCSAPPSLVGHLLGGSIAAWFASGESPRLSRLVLIDSFGLTPLAPAAEFGAAISEFLAAPSQSSHRSLWRYCAHDSERVQRELGASWRDFEA
jgi:pimeloyl-ACP methyl ester carboxylesterase